MNPGFGKKLKLLEPDSTYSNGENLRVAGFDPEGVCAGCVAGIAPLIIILLWLDHYFPIIDLMHT